ncbi:type IV toxin-antitoxin system AbiEi family antitoxin domain-containing protein [Cryptosporangium aurantiacum]|uniref:type IV toxin-antitoxin system AbiEi family antitoxin domain-containing protein n=1 Tax=Cryptosporangium aurantiacum TaxID=134849 RepID=UPI000A07523A|nr:type IV toxin-antitoxin system AbiEi family antitoxin domain-containing protein [Cryptosporangium aurantiacum]
MDLSGLIERQSGLLLRSQANAAGVTDDAIRWHIARGEWQRVLKGLYATFSGPPTEEHRLIAATLYGGEGTQITGAAALRRHGVRYAPDDRRVHILVPLERRRSHRGFVIVTRTARPDQHPRLLPAMEICSVARAGADAARAGYPLTEIRAFLAEIVQRRLAPLSAFERELAEGSTAHSAVLRRVVAELKDGVRSAPEAEMRDVVALSSVLPPVQWNPRLIAADGTVLPTPDGWIQDVGLALETDSKEFHTSPVDWQRTLERHNLLARYGIMTLHFTPREIREHPEKVLATIEQTYRERPRGFRGAQASGGKS